MKEFVKLGPIKFWDHRHCFRYGFPNRNYLNTLHIKISRLTTISSRPVCVCVSISVLEFEIVTLFKV